jgi:hypothetical protein
MNFTELYQRIRSIDEGAPSEPTAPGGVIKTKNADGTVSYKPKVPGERLTSTLPANQGAKTTDKTDNTKKEPTPANESLEECGDMMPMGMMGMSGPQGQQDNIDMNITLHGSGSGGVRDLMNILRNIESSDNKDVHSHDVSKIFGGNITAGFDEEMSDGGFGDASTTPDPTVGSIDAVTDIGAPINGGDHRKRQAGLPQGAPMHETLVDRLSALYNEIKEAKEEEFDALKHVKNPTKGEKEAAKDVKRGSYADRAAMLKSAEADGRLKKESYNPNSVDAEHRRGLEKSHEDSLKKQAADGDESAKKRLQALKDKKERMRNDYNARMER